MKASEHGPNLIKLTRGGWVNCYLVRDDDGLTLVDSTYAGGADDILAAAGQAGGTIVRIALTHAHGDHVGSVDALRERLPDAELVISGRDARFLRGDKSLDPGEPGKARGGFPTLKSKPTRELAPGDRVGSLEAVASPGHTVGHLAFFDTRDRTLIAGDAFQTLGGTAVAGVIRPLFPFVAFGTGHKPTAAESARRLRGLEPSRLAVGHGKVLESPIEEMERAIARAGG
jgi:glyoxylase-like metal-dependent hydrolase (beta-lactamase superfamily II)